MGFELFESEFIGQHTFLHRLHQQSGQAALSPGVTPPLSFENIGRYAKMRDWTPQRVSAAYARFIMLIEEQKTLEAISMDMLILAASFANLRNLRTVVLQSSNFGQMDPAELPKDVLYLQKQTLLTPYRNVSLRANDVGKIHFRNLIRAAGVNDLTITELVVMDNRHMNPENLLLHPGDLVMVKRAFKHIRRLYLKLPRYNGEYVAGYFEGQLGVLMQSMPQLEDLSFVASSASSYVPWLSAWNRLCIPLLRSLSVQCIDFTEDDLVDYFERHAKTLRVVTLSCIEMRDGSFSSLFHRMRNSLNLDRLTLDGIFEDIEGFYAHYSPEVVNAIEQFVTRRSAVYPDREIRQCLYEQTIDAI